MGHYDDNAGLWPERVSEGGYFWSTVTLVARRRQQMSAASLQAMPSGLPISSGQHRQNYALQTTARPEAILHSRGCRAQRRPYSAGSIRCSDSNGQGNSATLPAPSSQYQTGGTAPGLSIGNQAKRLRKENLVDEKFVVVVRHGQTTWNEAKRIQGDSDESKLTKKGEEQAGRVRSALVNLHFDSCFSSPIQRANKFAKIIWRDRTTPIIKSDLLREANLGYMQGMTNADAAEVHKEGYAQWRAQPADFWIDDYNPLNEVFRRAEKAWQDILAADGSSHLCVTHKSIMRAMMCVALGLPTASFRAVEIHNGGVSVFRISKNAEPMLVNMNMTTHMHHDGVTY